MKKLLFIFCFPLVIFGQSFETQMTQLITDKSYKQVELKALQVLESKPEDLVALEFYGDALAYQHQWDAAIEVYEKLINKNDQNANYHYKYGGAMGMKALKVSKLRALGMIGDIKTAFIRAAELDPKHIDTRWALVEYYIQLPGIIGGSKAKALKYAGELEQLSLVDGYLAKGYIHEYDEAPQMAEMYFKKAIEVGGSLTCFQKLTDFYEKENRPEDAIQNIETAYKNHSRNALHYQIGKVCADYNVQLDKGERCLKAFIKNHSAKDGVPIEWAYFRLAQIYKNRINKTEALNWINKAIAVRMDFEQALEEKEKILKL
jgi:tetratricopeptide (TPR) repeat protein